MDPIVPLIDHLIEHIIDRFILHWLPGRPQRCIARFRIPEIPLRRPAVALPLAS